MLQKLLNENKTRISLIIHLANMSSEEYEMREFSTEERNLLGVVMKGCCIMINCTVHDCLSAGVLVLNKEE